MQTVLQRILGVIGLCLLTTPVAAADPTARIPRPAKALIQKIPVATVLPSIRQQPLDVRHQTLCLALAIYHEARGATETEQMAVAHVIFNRTLLTGASVCATIWADRGSQFQWVRRGDRLLPNETDIWQTMQRHAFLFVRQRPADITHGATLFYNPKLCSPIWAKSAKVTVQFQHIFLRETRHARR